MAEYLPPYGKRHVPIGGEQDKTLYKFIDHSILKDYERFVRKVNERTLFQRGIISKYNSSGDPALGLEVEYFHPSITADDRMVYIMENIVSVPGLDWRDIIGNTTISHFYGARGVHSVLTGIADPKRAHIDFVRLGNEQIAFKKTRKVGKYTKHLRKLAREAKLKKKSIWGTTELHTSIQTAGRRFVNGWYKGNARHKDKGTWSNVSEWIASWTHVKSKHNDSCTVMEGIKNSTNLQETFKYLTGETHIGEYYGYHCSTSNSINPALNFTHDDTFVAPGPGARETLDRMFPGLSTRKVSYGDRVVWIRENQHKILNLKFDKSLWNYTNSYGITIFKDQQNELKSYGTEVSLCQYSVYCRLRSNPELISRRKVARVDSCKPKKITKTITETEEKGVSLMNTILDIFRKKSEPEMVPEQKDEQPAVTQVTVVETYDSTVSSKEKIILDSITRVGCPCTHNQVLKDIQENNLASMFDVRTNWKETWKIMKDLTKRDILVKEGRHYTLNG